MELEQVNGQGGGRFNALKDGEEVGYVNYSWMGKDRLSMDYVKVRSELSGQGIGKEIVVAVADFAREHDLKITPVCGFARITFQRNEELHDVLA